MLSIYNIYMKLKQYKKIKLGITILIAMVFSQALVLRNFIAPLIVLIAAYLVLLALRRRVDEVIADERDYNNGGRAAMLAVQIYSWLATIAMIVLYSFADRNPAYGPIAMTLAYSTCLLMLIYSLIFRYYGQMKFSDKKTWYILFVLLMFLISFIFSARLFSGEDDWRCVNGAWQPHGQPNFPAPQTQCQ